MPRVDDMIDALAGLSLVRGSGSLTLRFRLGPPRTEPKGPVDPRISVAQCARGGAMHGGAGQALIV